MKQNIILTFVILIVTICMLGIVFFLFVDANTITYNEMWLGFGVFEVRDMPYQCSSSASYNITMFSNYKFLCSEEIIRNPYYKSDNVQINLTNEKLYQRMVLNNKDKNGRIDDDNN